VSTHGNERVRRKRFTQLCIACCFVVFEGTTLLGCHASQSAKETDKLVVTDPDKGRSIELREGQVLEVRLESQPTTGYKWSVHSDTTEKLTLIDQTETKPETPGYDRPVFQIFKFRAQQNGSGKLHLVYARSWEKSKPPARSYELDITIQRAGT